MPIRLLVALISTLAVAPLSAAVRPDQSIIPSGISLTPCGPYLYTEAGRSLARLDRRTGNYEVLFSGRNPVYRFAVTPDNNRILIYCESEPYVHHLYRQGGKWLQEKISLPWPADFSATLDSMTWDETGLTAYLYTGLYIDRAAAFRITLNRPARAELKLAARGRIVAVTGRLAVYQTYSVKDNTGSYIPGNNEALRLLDMDKADTLLMTVNGRNEIQPLASENAELFGFRLQGYNQNNARIILLDKKTGGIHRKIPLPRTYKKQPIRIGDIYLVPGTGKLVLQYSPGEKFITGRYLTLDWQAGKISPSSDRTLAALPLRQVYNGFGNTGNGLLYRHIEYTDTLVVVDIAARTWSETSLAPFANVPSVEWGGLIYYFAGPDEFYCAVEKGGGRYFIRFPFQKIHPPSKPIPAGVSPFEFIQWDLSSMRSGKSSFITVPSGRSWAMAGPSDMAVYPDDFIDSGRNIRPVLEEWEDPNIFKTAQYGTPDDFFEGDDFTYIYERHGEYWFFQRDGTVVHRPVMGPYATVQKEYHYSYKVELGEVKWPIPLHITYADPDRGPQEWTMYLDDIDTLKDRNGWVYKRDTDRISKKAFRSKHDIDRVKNKDAVLTVRIPGYSETPLVTDEKPVMLTKMPSVLYAIAPDGTNILHFEHYSRPVNEAGDRTLYFNNQPVLTCQDAYGFIFTPNGRHHAFIAEMTAGGKGKIMPNGWQIYRKAAFFDGSHDGRYWDDIHFVHMSPDGKRTAYTAVSNGLYYMVVDGVPGPAFELVRMFEFRPDGRAWMYIAASNGQESLVYNGRPGLWVSSIDKCGFSGDSRKWYYFVFDSRNAAGKVLYINGKPYAPKGYLPFDLYYTPDGRQEYLLARAAGTPDGKPGDSVFLNGKRLSCVFDISINESLDHAFVISPNGKSWGFFERLPVPDGAGYLSTRAVINGKRLPDMKAHFLSALDFSGNGSRHYFHGAVPGVGGWVIEGTRKGPLNSIDAGFGPDNRLYYWGIEENRYSRVYIDHKPRLTLTNLILASLVSRPSLFFNKKGDSAAIAFRVWNESGTNHSGKLFFMKNFSEAGGPYDGILSLEYSPLTDRFTGIAVRNRKLYLVQF